MYRGSACFLYCKNTQDYTQLSVLMTLVPQISIQGTNTIISPDMGYSDHCTQIRIIGFVMLTAVVSLMIALLIQAAEQLSNSDVSQTLDESVIPGAH